MAIAFVQVAENRGFTGTTQDTVLLGAPVGSGNAVAGIMVIDDNGAGTFVSVTDDQANPYIIAEQGVNNGNKRAIAFVGGNLTNAPQTIKVNLGGAFGNWELVASEYSGVLANANPMDNSGASHISQVQPTPTTATDAQTSTSITTVTNGCMLVGLAANLSGASLIASAGTGFTGRPINTNAFGAFTEDKLQATAGSAAATFTSAANTPVFTAVIALQPAGGGGGDTFANAGSLRFMREKAGELFKPVRKLLVPGWRPEPAFSF